MLCDKIRGEMCGHYWNCHWILGVRVLTSCYIETVSIKSNNSLSSFHQRAHILSFSFKVCFQNLNSHWGDNGAHATVANLINGFM